MQLNVPEYMHVHQLQLIVMGTACGFQNRKKTHAETFAVFKTARPKFCGFETANQNRTLKICGFKTANLRILKPQNRNCS